MTAGNQIRDGTENIVFANPDILPTATDREPDMAAFAADGDICLLHTPNTGIANGLYCWVKQTTSSSETGIEGRFGCWPSEFTIETLETLQQATNDDQQILIWLADGRAWALLSVEITKYKVGYVMSHINFTARCAQRIPRDDVHLCGRDFTTFRESAQSAWRNLRLMQNAAKRREAKQDLATRSMLHTDPERRQKERMRIIQDAIEDGESEED
jgi:hypothetical protein